MTYAKTGVIVVLNTVALADILPTVIRDPETSDRIQWYLQVTSLPGDSGDYLRLQDADRRSRHLLCPRPSGAPRRAVSSLRARSHTWDHDD